MTIHKFFAKELQQEIDAATLPLEEKVERLEQHIRGMEIKIEQLKAERDRLYGMGVLPEMTHIGTDLDSTRSLFTLKVSIHESQLRMLHSEREREQLARYLTDQFMREFIDEAINGRSKFTPRPTPVPTPFEYNHWKF